MATAPATTLQMKPLATNMTSRTTKFLKNKEAHRGYKIRQGDAQEPDEMMYETLFLYKTTTQFEHSPLEREDRHWPEGEIVFWDDFINSLSRMSLMM